MNYPHPQLDAILNYTARRLSCEVTDLSQEKNTILTAKPPANKNFLQTTALNKRDVICVTQLQNSSIIRTHPQPNGAVKLALKDIQEARAFNPKELLENDDLLVSAEDEEPYLYLAPDDFTPFKAGNIRQLSPDDQTLMDDLHNNIEENMCWFVELNHPIVYGCFENNTLVAAASHFLFEEERIAAGGVLTHPNYRGKGYGKAVSSTIMQWALEHNWICEWSSWAGNPASIALSKALGFKQFSTDTEYQINYKKKTTAQSHNSNK